MITTLFDKSFLQSLSLDESVWFDHYFIPNICPLFYVETLADLQKALCGTRTPEEEVKVIASKFPEMHGTPNLYHVTACEFELFGNRVPLTGQIPIGGGHPVSAAGRNGVVFDESPEAAAFSRWQEGKFGQVEKLFASAWRKNLSFLDLNKIASQFRKLGIDGKTCKSLEDVKNVADLIVSSTENKLDRLYLALMFLGIDPKYHSEILQRWSISNYRVLPQYAPYVTHVFRVELFFQLALAANLISSSRPSNRIDVAYLFYLPFCKLFVSSDRLHKRCAPHFLRKDQQFIWGPDLKSGYAR